MLPATHHVHTSCPVKLFEQLRLSDDDMARIRWCMYYERLFQSAVGALCSLGFLIIGDQWPALIAAVVSLLLLLAHGVRRLK